MNKSHLKITHYLLFGIGFWIILEAIASYIAFQGQWEGFQYGRIFRVLIGIGLVGSSFFIKDIKLKP